MEPVLPAQSVYNTLLPAVLLVGLDLDAVTDLVDKSHVLCLHNDSCPLLDHCEDSCKPDQPNWGFKQVNIQGRTQWYSCRRVCATPIARRAMQ